MTKLAQTSERIEVRCPVGARNLLMVVRRLNENVTVTNDNLLELACRDCRQNIGSRKGTRPKRVLHRFNVIGELVESEVEW